MYLMILLDRLRFGLSDILFPVSFGSASYLLLVSAIMYTE